MIHTVKGFSVVNETETDVFPKFPCFFYNPANVGNLISSYSFFSKPSLYIWVFFIHIILKLSKRDFKFILLVWEMNVIVRWLAYSLVLSFLEIGMRIDSFHHVDTAGSSRFADVMNAKP